MYKYHGFPVKRIFIVEVDRAVQWNFLALQYGITVILMVNALKSDQMFASFFTACYRMGRPRAKISTLKEKISISPFLHDLEVFPGTSNWRHSLIRFLFDDEILCSAGFSSDIADLFCSYNAFPKDGAFVFFASVIFVFLGKGFRL